MKDYSKENYGFFKELYEDDADYFLEKYAGKFDDLFLKYKNATNKYQKSNYRDALLVQISGYVAKKISDVFPTYWSRDSDDFLQVGLNAVSLVLDLFDPTRGTYCSFFEPHIVGAAQKYIDKNYNHLSGHYSQAYSSVIKAINYLEAREIPYNNVVLSEMTNISVRVVKYVLGVRFLSSVDGFDYGKDEDGDFSDESCAINANHKEEPVFVAEDNELLTAIAEAFKVLSKEEKEVMEKSFGLCGKLPMSEQELAKEYGKTVFDVQTLIESAKKKLRTTSLKGLL